ncbi:hypothetical protein PsAD2_02993 [Pseudovibrio axinellae]|uniref:Uncharacterized protein n=1 Tax=Pseudovibrio axinellae TaxID=989403 RepID=A0A165XFF9_9HYPH|nr:hypothetical protein [Pseudovibrio axinellae]KZL17657.1 hypothetical protein PsAD2_02993 [Pseudovibrio axinellae]SER44733.1 hypothetical protein SAMN05421798_11089 [Pseudovibrio axinellae]
MNAILKALAAAQPISRRPGAPVVIPLAGFYRRSDKLEGKRYRFYAAMAREFDFENWHTKPAARSLTNKDVGRNGKKRDLRISRNNILVLDANSAPFEWLVFNDKLHDPTMHENIANDRADAGFRFRQDMSKAEISGLRSPDWMSEPTGSQGPKFLAGTKLEAMESISKLTKAMPKEYFDLLERVVWCDEWVWERKSGKGKRSIIVAVQRALDYAALHYNLLPKGEFWEKWLQSEERNKVSYYVE